MRNLLGDPDPTLLPAEHDAAARARLDAGEPALAVAADHPDVSLVWGVLARAALADGQPVTAYAYARTGYHRGLDALRRAGWKGAGPIPAAHVPNQGFLIALLALADAAAAIGEDEEAARCRQFAHESDPASADL